MDHETLLLKAVKLDDQYEYVDKLGKGAQGVVVKVKHKESGEVFALKTFDFLLEDEILEREIKTHRSLNHPNIVKVYQTSIESKKSFMLMEYVEGRDIEKYSKGKALELSHAVHLLSDICSGLEYLHNKKIIHRDIKPSNIFVSENGTIKLGDLGVAKKDGSTTLQFSNGRSGTAYYQTYELIKGDEKSNFGTDIYALGMTWYQMITGRLPFERNGIDFYKTLEEGNYLPPSYYNEKIPKAMDGPCLRAISRNISERYTSIFDFYQDVVQAWENNRVEEELKKMNDEEEKESSKKENEMMDELFGKEEFQYLFEKKQSSRERGIWFYKQKKYLLAQKCFEASKDEVALEYLTYMYTSKEHSINLHQYIFYEVFSFFKENSDYVSPEIYYILGMMFEFGIGTYKDNKQAKKFYNEFRIKRKGVGRYIKGSRLYHAVCNKEVEYIDILNEEEDEYRQGLDGESINYIWESFFAESWETAGLQTLEMPSSREDEMYEYLYWKTCNYLLDCFQSIEDVKYPLREYFSQEKDSSNYSKLKEYCEQKITEGDARAMWLLANINYLGNITDNEKEFSFQLMKKASKKGVANAYIVLGKWAREGIINKKNEVAAMNYFERAVVLSKEKALLYLGCMYEERKNEEWSEYCYWKSAKIGNKYGLYQLGKGYEKKADLEKNQSLKINYKIKAAYCYIYAYERGYKDLAVKVGNIYYYGIEDKIEQDKVKALWCYKDAARRGDTDGWYMCGKMHELGEAERYDNGIFIRACYENAAKDKNNIAALERIADIYFNGEFEVQKDTIKALGYYDHIKDKIDILKMEVIVKRLDGLRANKDEELCESYALYWYEKASRKGSVSSMLTVAKEYLLGKEINRDTAKGIYWLEQATDAGDSEAAMMLGREYYNGILKGEEKSSTKALELLEKAAAADNTEAMRSLMLLYEQGCREIIKNIDKAVHWYRRALESEDWKEIFNDDVW